MRSMSLWIGASVALVGLYIVVAMFASWIKRYKKGVRMKNGLMGTLSAVVIVAAMAGCTATRITGTTTDGGSWKLTRIAVAQLHDIGTVDLQEGTMGTYHGQPDAETAKAVTAGVVGGVMP